MASTTHFVIGIGIIILSTIWIGFQLHFDGDDEEFSLMYPGVYELMYLLKRWPRYFLPIILTIIGL